MTREQIEKEIDARLEEPDNNWDGIFNSGYSRGFREGAQWRINSVWHGMNEKPSGMFAILAEFGEEEYSLGITLDGMESAKRWAYVSYLLPDRKEETE